MTFFGLRPLSLLALLLFATCAPTTPFGEVPSIAAERAFGEERKPIFVRSRGGIYRNRELVKYVNAISDKLEATAVIPEEYGSLEVEILNTNDPSAFALPGGSIFVTRGMIAFAEDEAQLAGVIAHEIGHVIARHSAKAIASNERLILDIVREQDQRLLASSRARQIEIVQRELEARVSDITSFSKEQELEADKLSVQMMLAAGYDPNRFGKLLERLGKQEDYFADRLGIDAAKREELGRTSGYPKIPERIAALGTFPELPIDDVARERLMEQVDGVFYDDRYRGGILRDNTFWSPAARLAVDIPDRVVPTQGNGLVLLSAHGVFGIEIEFEEDETLDGLAATMRARRSKYGTVNRTNINGFPAITARSESKRGSDKIVKELTILELDRGFALFYMAGDLADEKKLRPIFSEFLNSARTEKNGSRGRLYYRTRKVKPGETVNSLADESKFGEDSELKLRLVNELDAGSEPTAGDWIKLVK